VHSLVAISLAASLLAGPPTGALLEGPSEGPSAAPGGYRSLGELREREPVDGHDNLTIGSVLFSLGLIRAGAGGVSVYMATRPDLCSPNCASMGPFGWSGVGFGGLMFVTGIVLFSIGASQQAKHRRWQQGLSSLKVAPWWTASRSTRELGLSLDLRF